VRRDRNIWTLSFPVRVLWLPADGGGLHANQHMERTVYWTGPWLLGCAWWVAARRRRAVYWLWGAALVNSVLITVQGVEFYSIVPTKSCGFGCQTAWWQMWRRGFCVRPRIIPHCIWAGSSTATQQRCILSGTGAGLALALHTQRNAEETGRDTGLLWVVLTGCAVVFCGLILSGSRRAFAGHGNLGVGAVLLAAGVFCGPQLVNRTVGGKRDISDDYFRRHGSLFHGGQAAVAGAIEGGDVHAGRGSTIQIIQATRVMIPDRLWLGFGGGSFRYISPYYFRDLEDVYRSNPLRRSGGRGYHAHCDPLQLAMEYGILGAGVLLVILLYWAVRACWLAGWLG